MSLWIYKCNSQNGEWAEFFERAKESGSSKQRWGGPDWTTQPHAKKLAESMQVGQRVLCWQRWSAPFEFPPPPGMSAAAVGIVEFAGLNPEGNWLFVAKDQFSDPVPLLKWSKTSPIIGRLFSFPRRIGTLIDLSSAEEREVLRICSKELGRKIG